MAYNNSIRKQNKLLSSNLYAPSGVLKIGEVPKGSTDFSLGYIPSAGQAIPYISKSDIPDIKNIDLQSSIKAPSGLSKLTGNIGNSIFTAAGQAIGSALAGGKSSGVGNFVSGAGKYISMIPGPIGKFGGAAAGIIGGGINALAGAKFNDENIAALESAIDANNNFEANASSYDTLSDLISTTGDVATNFSDSYIGSQGIFSNAVTNKADSLRAAAELANTKKDLAILNNAENIRDDQLGSLLASSFAYGGSIHIKSENRGKFTATKKRTGKTTEELTHSKNPVTKNYKRFAPMMSLYAEGGRLNSNSYQVGQVYDVDEATINKLKSLGYEFDIL